MKYEDWTVHDEGVANYQGWTLAIAIRETNTIELQRLEELGIFQTDIHAWLHVYNGFLAGDKVCKKALMILADENRTEFLRIKEYGELYFVTRKIE